METFSNTYNLSIKKRMHLNKTVIDKLRQLQGFIPEQRELSEVVLANQAVKLESNQASQMQLM